MSLHNIIVFVSKKNKRVAHEIARGLDSDVSVPSCGMSFDKVIHFNHI